MYTCSREKANRCYGKSEFQMFSLISAAVFVSLRGSSDSELYKFAWNVLANNSRTGYLTALSLGKLFVYESSITFQILGFIH